MLVGRSRLEAWIVKLDPCTHHSHFRLLQAIFQQNASLAASFLRTARIDLTPKIDSKWVAGMSIVAQGCLGLNSDGGKPLG